MDIDWPEARIRVEESQVRIEPMESFEIRSVVADGMILAGEAAVLYAVDHQIPFPFNTQAATDGLLEPGPGLADQFARRRQMKPGRVQSSPGSHAALGVSAYTRHQPPAALPRPGRPPATARPSERRRDDGRI